MQLNIGTKISFSLNPKSMPKTSGIIAMFTSHERLHIDMSNGAYVYHPDVPLRRKEYYISTGRRTKNRSQRLVENAIQRRVCINPLVTPKKRVYGWPAILISVIISIFWKALPPLVRSQSRYYGVGIHFNYLYVRRGVPTRLCGKYNRETVSRFGQVVLWCLVGMYWITQLRHPPNVVVAVGWYFLLACSSSNNNAVERELLFSVQQQHPPPQQKHTQHAVCIVLCYRNDTGRCLRTMQSKVCCYIWYTYTYKVKCTLESLTWLINGCRTSTTVLNFQYFHYSRSVISL